MSFEKETSVISPVPTTRRDPRSERVAHAPSSVVHQSFDTAEAPDLYNPANLPDSAQFADKYMPDDVTRLYAKYMHYAAYRWKRAKGVAEISRWEKAYIALRDQIVLGNRKLVYKAVRRRMAQSNRADDLIGDCHIVLIQAVAAYNPWLGIRFSTYAFTCLVRALSRMAQRQSRDWLARSVSLDAFPEGEPGHNLEPELTSNGFFRIDEYLHADHPLLTYREKVIISRRFCHQEQDQQTLEKVGLELGLSKERVRQVQASALGKLRQALLGQPVVAAV